MPVCEPFHTNMAVKDKFPKSHGSPMGPVSIGRGEFMIHRRLTQLLSIHGNALLSALKCNRLNDWQECE